jgi:hypothetical protein
MSLRHTDAGKYLKKIHEVSRENNSYHGEKEEQ